LIRDVFLVPKSADVLVGKIRLFHNVLKDVYYRIYSLAYEDV